jgi:methyltransferase (TIGR00027 family)
MRSEPSESLPGVSETALGAAEMRAEESARTDRLIDDPYAASFVAAAPPLFPDVPSLTDDAELASLIEAGIAGVAVRTRFFDDHLRAACESGCRQVVLLASDLDARAFRLDWPDGMRLFEVVLPELFAFKEPVLAAQKASPRCDRRVVSADLRADWPARLTAVGFEPNRVSTWIAEGLLVYLSHQDAVRLLTDVRGLAARESQLSFDYDMPDQDSTLRHARDMEGMQEVAAMWRGGLAEDPAEWLPRHGWTVDSISRAAFGRSYGRELRDPTGGFLTATCR